MRRPLRDASAVLLMLVGVTCVSLAVPPPPAGARVRAGRQAPPKTAALLRIPFPQEDGDLNPYGFELGYPLVMLVYDSLLWRDESGTARPWLAQAMDQSPDGRRLTLHLAPGAQFQDGTPLSADDVVFSYRYFASHRHPRFTAELAAMRGIRAADASTVVVELDQPSPGFTDQPLADVPILPAHLWRDLPTGRRAPDGPPVGSGPYRLVQHDVGKSYRFEANREYFRGPPSVNTIEVPIVRDADSTLQALESRRIDLIPLSLPPDAEDRVKGLGVKVVSGASYVGTALVFNLRHGPFDRLEARQVVAKALDLRRLATAVGSAVPADHGYLHPASPWSSPVALQAPDPDGARKQATGLGIPPVDVVAPDNDPASMEAARQVVLALQRVGLRANVANLSREAYSKALGEDGLVPDFDLAVVGISPLASYEPDFLRRMFGPESGALNPAAYRSSAFDELAARVAATTDPAGRRAAVGEELRRLATDLPGVPLMFPIARFAYRPAIYEGWVYVKGTGILDKQSFVPRAQEPAPASLPGSATTVARTGSALEERTGRAARGTSPVQVASVALGALALGMVAFGFIRWWRFRQGTR